jgi:hypothetical protein
MAEVFTISGAENGHGGGWGWSGSGLAQAAAAAAPSSCPAGWARTAAGNCAAPGGKAAPAALRLQTALKKLGGMVKDPVLANIKIDGVIGPATVAAFNKASASYVEGATAYKWSLSQVAANAESFSGIIETAIQKRGGTVPPTPTAPPVVAQRPPVSVKVAPPPLVEKKGLPTWAWVTMGLVGAVALTGGAYVAFFRKKKPALLPRQVRQRRPALVAA